MADELKIPLDPFTQTGLTLLAKVYAPDGTQEGSTVSMNEDGPAFYVGDFALGAVGDGEYTVRFETNTPDKLYGTGSLYVRNNAEVTPDVYFNGSLDTVANVTTVATTTTNTDMRGTDNAASQTSVDAVPADVWAEPVSTVAGTQGWNNLLSGRVLVDTTLTGTPTSTQCQLTAGSTLDDFYNDQLIYVVSGAGVGQVRVVTDYVGSTKTITVDEPWVAAASNGDRVVVQSDHVHTVSQIQANLATATNVTDAQTAIIAEVDANEVKIDALETKAQADARQVLIAKEATKFNPAIDVVANVTLVDTVTANTDMRGTDGANTTAPDNASIAAILVDTNELQTNQGQWLTATGFATPTNITDAQAAIISEVDANESKIDALETKAARLDALIENSAGDRFTAKALETAPTAEMDASELHTALDSYTNKDDWKSSSVDLSSVITAIDNLNDLSTADIDARLTAYGAPTLTEMTSAFTEIKGATWTTTDTLEAIRDTLATVGTSPADIWSYVTRGLTEDVTTDTASRDASKADLTGIPTASQNADAVWDKQL